MRIDWDSAELDQLLHSPRGVAAKALEEPGRAVEAEAKRLAPVRTGTLRDEITTRAGSDSDGPYVDIVSPARDEKGRPRGLFTEVGTNDTEAQPYLRPALDILR